ncbi:ExbD/TolR family protein [Roseateles toxinivorans]|uniref:Biopolymer transport protein ExbD/biopolymer transport protein TolR n=1 Tax=Roseateles toxinivorans TaxID=270368 RepID=A0A4R6QQ90_9BURK|nr:biopolymer transporter ExbD [Roseateles toxinivorans]TDP72883.1 biopolymer transport protein ExbD/biopolymer transport protein TolR [Roseateles toxinivorans]
MAFGRLERTTGPTPMSDINMTPLIDVMLVLLVIFMITAPLMSSSLRLDLPKTEAATPSDAPQFLIVALTPDGSLYLGDQRMAAAELRQRLAQAAQRTPGIELQLRADKMVPYGQVAELIGWAQDVGLNRIAFVAQPGER